MRSPSVAGMNNSPLYKLLATKLGSDPVSDMIKRRDRGESWRSISLEYLTKHDISVTEVTLRSWYAAGTTPASR